MGNIFSEIGKRAGDLVSYPVKIGKDLVTHPSKGWHELTHLYTHNEHKDQDLLQKGFGIHGWVGKHPQETAAAVVATIFGGWAAWGAYGAGAAGTAAGTATGATTGAVGGGTAAASAGGAMSFGGAAGSAMAYTPTASAVLGGSGGVGAAGIGSTGVGIAGESTASLGISGAGVTSMPEVATYSTGSLGSGSGWLGSDAAPISNSASWQDWVNRANQFSSKGGQEQQKAPKPHSNSMLNQFMGNGANRDFGTKQQIEQQPQTTTQLLGGNTGLSGTSFKNNFGSY
ncbi:TPA: hypothetical protein RFV54_001058 [Klebsiella aerogenes]|nr:hypothetical protein [Klebsiella aerogenes]